MNCIIPYIFVVSHWFQTEVPMRVYGVLLILVAVIVGGAVYYFSDSVPFSSSETVQHPYVGLAVKSREGTHLGHVRSVYVVSDSAEAHGLTVISRGVWVRGVRFVPKGKFSKNNVGFITLAITYKQFRELQRRDEKQRR